MPLFSTVKYYIMAGLGFLSVVLYALLQSEKKGRAQEKLNGIKQARKVERAVLKSTQEGLASEQEKLNNIKPKRSDFN